MTHDKTSINSKKPRKQHPPEFRNEALKLAERIGVAAEWLAYYNDERTHQGKMCCGRTPMETLLDGKRIWAEKNLSQM
ncbi:hypothetical protein EH228_19255 [Erwinia endophytica]|nr:hypothetical protein EH228_19255 [Erwinia endophytica]